jgi:hypothetical protein
MDYLVHPDVSEEIDNREADPLICECNSANT